MDTRLLQINKFEDIPIKKQKEFIKNISEGYNQDIYVCPEKKNMVRLKKQFIKKLSKKRKEEEVKTIAMVLMSYFKTENDYFYVDYGDDKFKNNNYYECIQFPLNELIKLAEEGAIHQSTKDKLINMKKEADEIDKENIVCFGHNWYLSGIFEK